MRLMAWGPLLTLSSPTARDAQSVPLPLAACTWATRRRICTPFSPRIFRLTSMSYESQGMRSSWRSLASSRVSALKDYVNQREYKSFLDRKILKPGDNGYVEGDSRKQSWRQWAGEKINRNGIQNVQEQVFLFPGWATRRVGEDRRSSDWVQGVFRRFTLLSSHSFCFFVGWTRG